MQENIKTNGVIEYKGEQYKLAFNLNVIESIQEEYGSIQKWGELTDLSSEEPNFKAVSFGITAMINEWLDMYNEENGTNRPFLTRKKVNRMLTEVGFMEMTEKMNDTVIEATKSDEKNA